MKVRRLFLGVTLRYEEDPGRWVIGINLWHPIWVLLAALVLGAALAWLAGPERDEQPSDLDVRKVASL